MTNNVSERVRAVVAKSRRRPVEEISIDATFEELGIDSLDGLNLLFEIESEFDVSIPDEEARIIHTVRQMVEGVERITSQPQSVAVSHLQA